MLSAVSLLIGGIILAAAALSFLQVRLGSRVGTDSTAHLFLIGQVRKHGGLFSRIPDLLNRPACGANPIYLHLILSHLPERALRYVPYLLNPLANSLNGLLLACVAAVICKAMDFGPWLAVWVTAFYVFCPQLFHALSARNFGFSSRGIGLLLLSAFLTGFVLLDSGLTAPTAAWALMIVSAFLVFAFNTFAMQSMLLISALLIPLRLEGVQWIAIAAGLALFVAIHPRYSLDYLRFTVRFLRAYATELAPIFILARRPSIWRDLVWDIPRRLARDPIGGLHYAYENSLIIVAVLNPLWVAAIVCRLSPLYELDPALAAATDIALAGLAALLLTSFRVTRFLGEPERYVEAVSPWIALTGAIVFATQWSPDLLVWVAVAFALVSSGQVALTRFLVSRVSDTTEDLSHVVTSIKKAVPDERVRLCSNNEQLVKLLLPNNWKFSYFTAVGELYCGMTVSETFSLFPHLRKFACEKIVREYGISVAVLQKSLYDTLFDDGPPTGLAGSETIYDGPTIRVIRYDWRTG